LFDLASPKRELETQNSKLVELNKKQQAENEFLKNELAKLKSQLEQSKNDKLKLTKQITSCKEEYESKEDTLNEKLKKMEEEKKELMLALEEYKEQVIKREIELVDANRQISSLNSELQCVKEHYESQQNTIITLKSDLNSYKAKILRLEMDNKELMQKSNTEEVSEKMWEKLTQCDQVLHELTRENEEQKMFIARQRDQLQYTNDNLVKKKIVAKKYKNKVKELKKERDLLKIEVLKVKLIYSDKCDNYKEAKNKLEKKLKEKKQALEALMTENMNNIHKKSMFDWRNSNDKEIEGYLKPKSLENTYKYHFNDLTGTLQANEMRKKMDLISIDEQIQKQQINNKRRDVDYKVLFSFIIGGYRTKR
jgi:chromosome segregation ATPase